MPEPILDIIVLGKAETAGSKRAFRNPKTGRIIVTDDNPRGKGWKAQVADAAREALDVAGNFGLYDGALFVEFTFYRPRPKGNFGSGRNANVVRDTAPAYPVTKPDALKLARAVEDALTGVVWRDDSQIVDEVLRKRFGEPARVRVRVFAKTEQIAADLPFDERVRPGAHSPAEDGPQASLLAA